MSTEPKQQPAWIGSTSRSTVPSQPRYRASLLARHAHETPDFTLIHAYSRFPSPALSRNPIIPGKSQDYSPNPRKSAFLLFIGFLPAHDCRISPTGSLVQSPAWGPPPRSRRSFERSFHPHKYCLSTPSPFIPSHFFGQKTVHCRIANGTGNDLSRARESVRMTWNDELKKIVEAKDRTRADSARQQATAATQLSNFASQIVNPAIREFMAELKGLGRRCELVKSERPQAVSEGDVLHDGFALKVYHGQAVECHFGILIRKDGELVGTIWMGALDQTFALGRKYGEVKKSEFQNWLVTLYQRGLGIGMTP